MKKWIEKVVGLGLISLSIWGYTIVLSVLLETSSFLLIICYVSALLFVLSILVIGVGVLVEGFKFLKK